MKSLQPFLVLFAFCATRLTADPSEDHAAWPNPPEGFRWSELGPRTTPVPVGDYAHLHHVAPSGSDIEGDGSRARPWRSVRHALGQANPPAGGRAAILVAAGRYADGVLQLRPHTDLYGGFAADTWERDIVRHASVLSGGGRDRVALGADNCRIDGFVLEDGVATGHGGALLCEGVSPAITHNVFRHNRTLPPADFPAGTERRRVRGHDGGAVALRHGSNADVRHNLFHDNETGIGGGGALSAAHDCLPRIGHNVFWGNRAGSADIKRTRSGNGGALALYFSSRAAVRHNLFVGNATLGLGDGGAVYLEYFTWPEVAFNAFAGNSSDDDGGALDHQKFSHVRVRANLFYGNRARKSGGAVHGDDSAAELENNIFAYNEAVRQGAGLGGTHTWVRALNNTFAHNTAQLNGGAVHLVNVKNPFLRPSVLRNNLMAFNAPDQVHFDSEVDAAYNIMHPGGFAGGYYNFAHPPGFRDDALALTVMTVSHDPTMFTTTCTLPAAVAGDLTGRLVRAGGHWTMVRAHAGATLTLWGPPPPAEATLEITPTFRLAPDSRAINAGTHPDFPATDIDGEPRQFPGLDIGADEHHPKPPLRR